MKLNRFGVFATLLAGTAFVGCSSDQAGGPTEDNGSVSFDLTTAQGVVITTVSYDLNTQGGADVASGSIPVPNPDSSISLGIESLPTPGSYTLAFSAIGMYQGEQVPCVSAPTAFSLAPSQDLELPTVSLVCQITTSEPDTDGSVGVGVNVVVEQIVVNNNIVEVFSYGPRSVRGVDVGGVCTFPPIQLNVFNNNTAISYAWAAAPDGTLALNAANTAGTYTCASGGDKTLTVTATMGTTTASKSVTVSCDASGCVPDDIECGDLVVEGTEQCDEATPRCTNCVLSPVCGDGVVDGPNGDCFGTTVSSPLCNEACDTSGPSATCDVNCQIIPIGPTCSDNIQNQGETMVDCGGPNCPACPIIETCTDMILNNGETEVDCGGPNCPACPPPGDPCGDCIDANAEIGPVQATYCDIDPLCTGAQECVLEAGCFLPIAAACFCGSNIDDCGNADFVPVGPCASEIRLGTGNPVENQLVLDRFFDFDYPAGVGMLILDEASRQCTSACFP